MPQTLLLVFWETQSNQHTSPSFRKLYRWCFGKHSQINTRVPHSANSTVGVLGNTVKSTHEFLILQTLPLVFWETQSNQHTSPSFRKLYRWCFGKHSQINTRVPHSANSTVGVLGNTVKSTHKGVNQHLNYVTQVQQRPRLPTVTLTWHAWTFMVHKLGPGEVTHTQKYLVGKELISRSK